MHEADWIVVETTEGEFHPTQLHHKETVFSLGNGYLGTRGSFEEGYVGDCAATLIHGVYDDAPIAVTELVNCPNWLPLTIVLNGDRFRLDQGTVLNYKRWLDLRRGLLRRQVRWQSPSGDVLEFQFERFTSLADQHVLALRCQITSVTFAGSVEVQSSINGYADTQGFLHWDWLDQGIYDRSQNDRSQDDRGNWLHVRSRYSKIDLGMASRLQVAGVPAQVQWLGFQSYPTIVAHFELQPAETARLEKVVTVFTSRDTLHPVQAAQEKLQQLPAYTELQSAHIAAWAKVWQANDVTIEGDSTAQLAIRYNLFQLLTAAPRHDTRVSIPAKTLTGFAYRGHVFWDTEIFVLPCLTLTQPDLARNLLTYRYHTLPGARRKAKAAGYSGAMYVWESADTGDEVTPTWVPAADGSGLVRIWCGDIELHISTDVAYAVWQYWQATQDHHWMQSYGAEMILDTAVFWGSRAEWNAQQHRYDINDVIGPDEYHERVNNNAFTNRMVQWHLQTALKVLEWLREEHPQRSLDLENQLDLSFDRLRHWQHVIEHLWIARDPHTGLIEQFQGFFQREDVNLATYEPRTRSMQAILGIEGANDRQILKQPDVLMMMYLLRQGAFASDAPAYDRATLQTNWDYYVPRTDHTYGSSLGPAVHAILACELDKPAEAYEHFLRAALVDLADVRGNAGEGIHAASTGGVWQAIVFGFAGIHLTEQGPIAHPKLPAGWTRLKFQLEWRGQTYKFDLQPEQPAPAKPRWRVRPIQGVIFDLDGVLTDTSEFHYLGWKRLADEVGVPFDRAANEQLRGVSRRDSLLFLLQGQPVTEAQLQEMMTRKNQYYLDLIRTITPDHLLPGALELLEELREAGIRVAVGSASKNARDVLQRLEIFDRLDAIADGHSVQQSKPAPDVFLHAATTLNVSPQNCLVVEDAEAGIEAGLRAGMWTVGLGPQERVGSAHLVLPNLQDVRWGHLRDELARRTSVPLALTLQHLMQEQSDRHANLQS